MTGSDTLDRSPGSTQPRMVTKWYINAGEHIEGPLSADELNNRAAGGELAPTDSVSADRVTWVPANSVPGLTFPTRPRQPLTQTVVSGSVFSTAAPDHGPVTVPVVTVAGYTILDTLGAGACGVVYKARQEGPNRIVALKTVLMPDKASPELLNRFRQESRALGKLQHPNIVALYDSGMCEKPVGQAFYAMELLDGEDLDVRLARVGALPEQAVWLIARQTAAALADAAKHGIIHRDVKPANLFLVTPPTGFALPEGVPMVKVTDFGLALSHAEGDQRQSVAGTLLGTPVYMAPEQFAGSDVDIRADIYGLGCTVYHALAGAPPFDGRTVWDVMMKKSAAAPPLAPSISPETAELVAAMLAISPDDRPPDYADLIARIDALPCMDPGQCGVRLPGLSGRLPPPPAGTLPTLLPKPELKPEPKPEPKPERPPRARRRWVYPAAAALLLGGGIGIAALAGAFNRPSDPDKGERPDKTERPKTPVEYDEVNRTELFVPTAKDPILGWRSQGQWKVEKDESEGNNVLTGQGAVSRAIEPPPHFGVVLGVDPGAAGAVEIVVATAGSTRWLIRIDKETCTAAFGKQVGAAGFEPTGTPVSLATGAGKRSYSTVAYKRAGGRLTAQFQTKELGSTDAAGLTISALRIEGFGAPIRIDRAELIELAERK